MNHDDLERLAEQFQNKADRAYLNYQETGITRYDNERRKNEDLADALRMAAAASDDHHRLIHVRGTFSSLAGEAKRIEYLPEDQKVAALESLRKNLMAAAKLEGVINDLS